MSNQFPYPDELWAIGEKMTGIEISYEPFKGAKRYVPEALLAAARAECFEEAAKAYATSILQTDIPDVIRAEIDAFLAGIEYERTRSSSIGTTEWTGVYPPGGGNGEQPAERDGLANAYWASFQAEHSHAAITHAVKTGWDACIEKVCKPLEANLLEREQSRQRQVTAAVADKDRAVDRLSAAQEKYSSALKTIHDLRMNLADLSDVEDRLAEAVEVIQFYSGVGRYSAKAHEFLAKIKGTEKP